MSSQNTARTRILWIWHAGVVAEYQKPLAELARTTSLDITLLVPRRWPERAGQMVKAEGPVSDAYRLVKACTLFTGFYYIYIFPTLLFQLLRRRPHIIYCYEEAHTLIAACVLLVRSIFLRRTTVFLYAAQNIRKRYPPPFRFFERYCFRRADAIVACGSLVARTLRSKGYRRPLYVVSLPTDTTAFAPDPELRRSVRDKLEVPDDALLIGYSGKLVEEKGLRTLWRAFREVAHDCSELRLLLLGGGPLEAELLEAARASGLQDRVYLPGVVHNDELPAYLNALDIFVLPSETRPNWREQFGRAIVEAMSCGIPVVGSDSGEIPLVVGDAGLIFREGNAADLTVTLRQLLDPALRAHLGRKGRERALLCFSLEKVAEQHRMLYEAFTQG